MSGLKEMTDDDLFDNASEADASEADDASEVGASEVGASEVDADEVGADEVGAGEVDAGEVDSEDENDADVADLDLENDFEGGSSNKQKTKFGGAKKTSEESAGTDEDDDEAGSGEAGSGEAGSGEAGAGEAGSGSDDESDADDEDYLQKFNKSMRDDLILNFHPESKSHNYEEIKQLAKVSRNKNGIVVDELHKTIPILTKYEKTRILGQRAKQIETGAMPLVQVPPNIIDSYLIAKLELAQNKIPFIIRRPLPNGGMEYWYVSDLENV